MNSHSSTFSFGMSGDGNSFAWQYTSLMIMILAFVIGAFTGDRHGTEVKNEVTAVPSEAPVADKGARDDILMRLEQGGFLVKDLFFSGNAEVNLEKFEALRTVLMSHDVTLQIELFGDGCNPEEAEVCRKLLFERAEVLLSKFMGQAAPLNSVNIYVVSKYGDAQAKISYFEENT